MPNWLLSIGMGETSMATQATPLETIFIRPRYLLAKRVLDILFTLLILLPLCIIVFIVSLLICLNSEGPPFFCQKRIGLNGAEFTMFKFRSMYINQDDTLHRDVIKRYMQGEQLCSNEQNGAAYKLNNDPRITRIGRFIRKSSIDELPQLFNVLRGEMTLVGPRPPLTYEVEQYSSRDWLRLAGKPGLTGYWQVYGRSQVTFQEMVELDIAYLQHQSIWEDIKLIALTVPVMITGRGGA
jgi:lipopolysaccharide/colanic/teichoic acid biosynthesis glycosyltransferase